METPLIGMTVSLGWVSLLGTLPGLPVFWPADLAAVLLAGWAVGVAGPTVLAGGVRL